MRKILKTLTVLFLALSLMCFTACDIFNGDFGKPSNPPSGSSGEEEEPPTPPQTTEYSVIFYANGGSIAGEFSSYTAGEEKNLPDMVEKDHYVFDGWFSNENFDGNRVRQFRQTRRVIKNFTQSGCLKSVKWSFT